MHHHTPLPAGTHPKRNALTLISWATTCAVYADARVEGITARRAQYNANWASMTTKYNSSVHGAIAPPSRPIGKRY